MSKWTDFSGRSLNFYAYELLPNSGYRTTTYISATLEGLTVTPLSSPVPEPTSYGVVAAGALAAIALARRFFMIRPHRVSR